MDTGVQEGGGESAGDVAVKWAETAAVPLNV